MRKDINTKFGGLDTRVEELEHGSKSLHEVDHDEQRQIDGLKKLLNGLNEKVLEQSSQYRTLAKE